MTSSHPWIKTNGTWRKKNNDFVLVERHPVRIEVVDERTNKAFGIRTTFRKAKDLSNKLWKAERAENLRGENGLTINKSN